MFNGRFGILRDIDGARNWITVGKLAAEREVVERTIQRDLDAFSWAGVALVYAAAPI